MDNVKIHNPYDNHRQNNLVYSNLVCTECTRKTIILEAMESSQFIQSLLKDKNLLENTVVDHNKVRQK